MARIWDQWMREHAGGDLPPVVPVVLHHSATGWTRSTRFVDGLAIPEARRPALAPHVPDFDFLLDDLTRISEEDLHARAVTAALRLLLSALRLGRDGEPADVGRWARLLLETLSEPNGHQAFEGRSGLPPPGLRRCSGTESLAGAVGAELRTWRDEERLTGIRGQDWRKCRGTPAADADLLAILVRARR